jgi:hypothetical protein
MSILSILRAGTGPIIEPGARAYPSVDSGERPLPVEDILAAHEDLISRVKLCYGLLSARRGRGFAPRS